LRAIKSAEAQTPEAGIKQGEAAKDSKNSITISGSNNSVTIGHIGDVTITSTPKPELRLGDAKVTQAQDGTYVTGIRADVIAPYTPGSLSIEAWAAGILGVSAVPQRTGSNMVGHTGVRPDFAFTTVMSPFGEYIIYVKTRSETNVQIKYRFE
jgi:hypothetical protein